MRRILATSMLLAGLLAPALPAQNLRFGIGPGLTLPAGDYGKADKLGFHGLGLVQLTLPGAPIALRADVMYSQTSHKNNVGGNSKLTGGTLDVVYPFGLPLAPVRPYLLAGVGYYSVKVDVTGFGSASQSKVAFGGGAGLQFKVGPSMRAFAEARYLSVSTSGGSTAFVPITVGLMFGGH